MLLDPNIYKRLQLQMKSLFNSIKPDTKFLISSSLGRNFEKNAYKGRVEGISNDNIVKLWIYESKLGSMRMERDKQYKIRFFFDKYLLEYICAFMHYKEDNGLTFTIIQLVGDGIKVQKRKFFRLARSEPLKFAIKFVPKTREEKLSELKRAFSNAEFLDDISKKKLSETIKHELEALNKVKLSDLKTKENETILHGKLIDISAGGIRFYTFENIIEGSIIRLYLELGTEVEILGKIITVDPKERDEDRKKIYQLRLRFIEIDVKTIEDISKYIWEEQRKERLLDKFKVKSEL